MADEEEEEGTLSFEEFLEGKNEKWKSEDMLILKNYLNLPEDFKKEILFKDYYPANIRRIGNAVIEWDMIPNSNEEETHQETIPEEDLCKKCKKERKQSNDRDFCSKCIMDLTEEATKQKEKMKSIIMIEIKIKLNPQLPQYIHISRNEVIFFA